jgi:two-component system NtrC family response regulator
VLERVGGREEIAVDVRIVCATHQNLKKLIETGRFREDLYYRLSEIEVAIPPLRDRPGDATLLAHAFMHKFALGEARPVLSFKQDALDAIEAYGWPGNVREMENFVKRAVIMSEGSHITAADLGLPAPDGAPEPVNLREVRDEAERRAIVRVLSRVDGNVADAAQLLGVSRPTLYDLINRHGLKQATSVKSED